MKLKIDNCDHIENLILDFGGVVLDIDVHRTLKAFEELQISGLDVNKIHPETVSPFLELELGLYNKAQFMEQLYRQFPDAARVEERAIWDAWNTILLDYDPKRIALIKELSKHYNLYLLSNTNQPHRIEFLERFENEFGFSMESMFVKCYYSDEMKLRKPDAAIYQSVLDDAGIDVTKSLFIDDNMCNFSGADEVGLKWYHLTGGETLLDIVE